MWRRLFLDHPRTIGESYIAHMRCAASFGLRMIGGGLACLVHALVPGWFTRTGSETICCLHDEMAKRRAK